MGPIFLCQFLHNFSYSITIVAIFSLIILENRTLISKLKHTDKGIYSTPLLLQQQQSIFQYSKQRSAQVGRKRFQHLQSYKLSPSSAFPIQVHAHNNKTHKKPWLWFGVFLPVSTPWSHTQQHAGMIPALSMYSSTEWRELDWRLSFSISEKGVRTAHLRAEGQPAEENHCQIK